MKSLWAQHSTAESIVKTIADNSGDFCAEVSVSVSSILSAETIGIGIGENIWKYH